ncbi:hypothetical protein BDW67DRAFT_187582, partial [Aspergillus spinulosporus]
MALGSRRADSLHGTAKDEAGAAIHSNTGETRPQGEPDIAAYEEQLVPKDIAEAACNEDEGADGERVSRESAQLAGLVVDVKEASDNVLRADTEGKTGLSEKLRETDEVGKENFAGKKLGTFDFGIIFTVLTVFTVFT